MTEIVKRYDLKNAFFGEDGRNSKMVEHQIGEWVKSDDYFKLFRERNRLREEVQDLERELRGASAKAESPGRFRERDGDDWGDRRDY